jgi:hypothetical protein
MLVCCRRYNNVLMDEERKMQAEMFLGLKARLYFPTLHLAYRWDSRQQSGLNDIGTLPHVPVTAWQQAAERSSESGTLPHVLVAACR